MSRRSLKTGAIVSYLWVVVHIVANFLYAPILISRLGKSEYGLYQIVGSFFAYISVFETSVESGVLKYYCAAKARNIQSEMENVLAICRRIYRFMTAILLVVGVVVIFGFNAFYASSFTSLELSEGTYMLALLFVNLAITMANAVYLASINANERFVFTKGLSCITQIMQPLICVLVLNRHPYALTVIIVQLSINCIVTIIRFVYAKKELHIGVHLHQWDKGIARSILIFAAGILLSNIADQIFWKTDQVILGKLFNTALVAVYAISTQLYTNFMYAGTTVASVFFPRISTLYVRDNNVEEISNLFIKVGRIAFLLTYLVLSGFVIFGRQFITIWVGKDFLPAYAWALIVMVPYTIDIIQHLGLTILKVMDLFKFRAKVYFLAAVLNIGLTTIMAYVWGAAGAAISTAVSLFVTSGLILNWFYKTKVRLDIRSFWKNILGILIKYLPIGIVFYILFGTLFYSDRIIPLALGILLYTVVYGVFGYLFVLNDYEKGLVMRFKRKLLG